MSRHTRLMVARMLWVIGGSVFILGAFAAGFILGAIWHSLTH